MESAFEFYGVESTPGPLLVTCEHATNIIPPPLKATQEDLPWLQTHWGYDIGAAEVSREIIRRTASFGVFSRFSRLICDPNRGPEEASWILPSVEGHPLSFNQHVDDTERQRRKELYQDPYHDAIDNALKRRLAQDGDVMLLSIHSFTPVFKGETREMEIGVLFDSHEAVAERLASLFVEEGFQTALNLPYSGFDHLIYAVNRHGNAHKLLYLELEVRQDLIDTDHKARVVGARIARVLDRLRLRTHHR